MSKNQRGTKKYVYQSWFMRLLTGLFDFAGRLMVGVFTLGMGLRVKPALINNPKHILVIRLDHIGDVLFSRPALESLRSRYPDAHITMMVSSLGAEVIRQDPAINDLLIWDASWFNRGTGKKKHSFRQVVRTLRTMDIDLSLDLRGDIRHHILLFLAGIPCRVGYGITGGNFLLHKHRSLQPAVHEVERDLDIIRLLGQAKTPVNYPPLALNRSEIEAGRNYWNAGKKHVVLHATAGDPHKCWPGEVFVRLCRFLVKSNCQVLLIGSEQERMTIDSIIAGCKKKDGLSNLAGKTTLRESAAIITNADLFIGHDSGPAHIAMTQRIATIMLWSNTNDPAEWGPWGEEVEATVIRRSAENSEQQIMNKIKVYLG